MNTSNRVISVYIIPTANSNTCGDIILMYILHLLRCFPLQVIIVFNVDVDVVEARATAAELVSGVF